MNDFPGMNNIVEPVLIQAFIAKATIKILNKPVLCRLARLDQPQFHSMFKSPLIQCATGKLRSLLISAIRPGFVLRNDSAGIHLKQSRVEFVLTEAPVIPYSTGNRSWCRNEEEQHAHTA